MTCGRCAAGEAWCGTSDAHDVKDVMDDIIASTVPHDPLRAYTIELAVNDILAHLAERGMVVLGADGEPLDMRPAMRALGQAATDSPGWGASWLAELSVTGPLADACLAAAEVEG
jgi:hypothetical protein